MPALSPPPPPASAPAAKTPRGWRAVLFDLYLLGELASLAVALGLGLNYLRVHALPLVYVSPAVRLQQSVARLASDLSTLPTPPSPAPSEVVLPVETVDLDHFHALTESPDAVVLDARPELFYRVGHIPGARSLSRAAFEQDYAALRPTLEAQREKTLAVYCTGGPCEDSHLVASALQRLGYPHVVIYLGGWEEWQAAGLPTEHR